MEKEENIYSFDSFINKINEKLIKTYSIDKTIEDLNKMCSSYNLSYSILKLNNNSFDLSINEYNKINYLKEIIEYILDSLFSLYGWFPSKLGII